MDVVLKAWPAAATLVASTVGAVVAAVGSIIRAARLASPARVTEKLAKEWALGTLAAEPHATASVNEAGFRALHRPRLLDFEVVLAAGTTRVAALLAEDVDDGRRAAAMSGYRDHLLMPLADEALRVDRPDQAAVVAGTSVDLLDRVPDAGLGLRTQALSAPAQVLERLVATPAARRATTKAIEQVYRAAALAAASRDAGAFDDACAALLPMAGAEVAPLLVRGGVVSAGNGDEPDRPLERLVMRLGDLGELAWPRRGDHLTNPRVWAETSDALARRLWAFVGQRGGQAEAETLLDRVLGFTLRAGSTPQEPEMVRVPG